MNKELELVSEKKQTGCNLGEAKSGSLTVARGVEGLSADDAKGSQVQILPSRPFEPEMTPGSVLAMAQAAMNRGLTAENVAVVERMFELAERVDARQSERRYNAALAALQKECQNVIATKDVDGKFRYATFLDIWRTVRPAVERNGFTLEWSQEHLGDRIKKLLTLRHTDGHKVKSEWTIRLGSNAPGMPSGTQAPILDEQSDTRAKRRLLLDALNVVVDTVSSAEDVGDGSFCSKEQRDGLFNRLLAIGGDSASQKRFLALAGVEDWEKIPKAVYPVLDRLMTEKEKITSKQR